MSGALKKFMETGGIEVETSEGFDVSSFLSASAAAPSAATQSCATGCGAAMTTILRGPC